MRISGLQKLTLLDYPGKVACTVFTSGCDLRCPFCHNPPLVLPERNTMPVITTDELLSFLKKRIGVLEGVAVTGGEPLLNSDMPELLKEIKALGYKIKLDTNGTFPGLLSRIIEGGLVDRVAVDIKNSPEKYPLTVGVPDFDISPVAETKDMLLGGSVEYEFRTTVVKGLHTEDDLLAAAEFIRGAKEYYLQQFRNPGDLIRPEGLSPYNEEEMYALAEKVRRIIPTVAVRGV